MRRIARFPALAVLVSASALISASSAENTGARATRRDARAPSIVGRAAPEAAVAVPALALDQIASDLGSITGITNAGDGRLFLTLQAGQIVIWDGSQVRALPFLDVTDRISSGGERGLLSTAFHPAYAQNGFFFVYYTDPNGDPTIARYKVSTDPNVADASSGVTLLTIPHPGQANHNGGQLQFGPDGMLYAGTGDGGSGDDPPCNAQRSDVLLGKLLRLDVDPAIANPPYYAIPAGNPFVGKGGPDQAWAKGLRNPWRFSFDRLTGDLYIGDVGQSAREEVDFQPAGDPGGENYGWKVMEGTQCGNGGTGSCPAGTPPCHDPSYVLPILDYTHDGGNCTIIGGYVYRGVSIPDFYGRYIYGDFCTGTMWSVSRQGGAFTPPQTLPITLATLSSFGQDLAGELYAADTNGALYRVRSTSVYAPALDAVAPASSLERGWTIVTLTGANFLGASQVLFGGVPALSTRVVDPGTLQVVAPPHAAGTVDITVVNPGASPATLAGAFTYEPLVRVDPNRGAPRTVVRP
ncbi:MAG TPA: PQQ-dependent sugar dehydrogenase [Thermoanaerobaculia bacterium]|nr:PQQ-dependent sugar dehydrogenase [Thermoanaerobaculia bacterium]